MLQWCHHTGLAAHFYDFEKNLELLRAINKFIENVVRPTQTNEKWYSSLKALIYEQVHTYCVAYSASMHVGER